MKWFALWIIFLLNGVLVFRFISDLSMPLLNKFKIKLHAKLLLWQEEKKINQDILSFTITLRSYLLAGVPPYIAMMEMMNEKKHSFFLGPVFSKVIYSYRHGKSLNESLSLGIVESNRVKSLHHLSLLLGFIRRGQKMGGNMVPVLDRVRTKIEDNMMLTKKIKMVTAQMRMQATIIALLPLVFGVIINFISPQYIVFFFQERLGQLLLCIMVLLNVMGIYFLKKILKVY